MLVESNTIACTEPEAKEAEIIEIATNLFMKLSAVNVN
jgi:hypothetical protein